jgi:DNA polymerase-3 subunit delta'
MTDPKEQIKSILKQGKMTGSWMIIGPYGVGKKAFAENLCSFLLTGNWEHKLDFHPDVKWVERSLTEEEKKETVKAILAGKEVSQSDEGRARKKEITVDDIRDALKFLSLKSSGSGLRILIINLADEMNENASNALLKMLEEPYPNTLILLLCQNTGRLLPTIRSRCRKIMLRPLPLDTICNQIRQNFPACKDVELIATLCDGSIGLAKDIIENNGIELYQNVLSLCVSASQLNIEKLSLFADMIQKDDRAYALMKVFILNIINEQAKKEAKAGMILAEHWTDLYQEAAQIFRQIDTLYLDKKQFIMKLFLQIADDIK